MDALLKVEKLKKFFPVRKHPFAKPQYVKAVNGVSFEIKKGEIMAVVGESGSGKSTLGRVVLRLLDPDGGKIFFDGTDITDIPHKELRKFRKRMQIVQQDPYNSLHPRKLVKDIIGEGLKIHTNMRSDEIYMKIKEILERVGLREEHMFRYPHEFSGGQRQRIAIARAIILEPDFIVLDEPTSALDVSVQARVLKLLRELKDEFSLTYMFITHDLAVVDYMADDVLVMYLGKPMEYGPKDRIFSNPAHPYTKMLLEAIPDIEKKRKKEILKGEIPNPISPPSGCVFHTRCPYAKKKCSEEVPEMIEIEPGHLVACHFPLI